MRPALIHIIDFDLRDIPCYWHFFAIPINNIPDYRTKISMFDRLFPVKPKNPI